MGLLLVVAGCGSSNPIKADAGGGSAGSAADGGAGGSLGGMGGSGQPTCTAGMAPGTRIGLENATATYSQTTNGPFSVTKIIDGLVADGAGWAVVHLDGTAGAETAALQTGLDTPAYPNGTRFGFVLTHNFNASGPHALGRFRLSVTTSVRTQFANGNDGLVTPGNVGTNDIWSVLTPIVACGLDDIMMTVLGDGSVLVAPNTVVPMAYTVIADTPLTGITGVRIETLKDPSLPFNGPGLQSANGNFVLSEFQMYGEAR